ncbi:MFS transporter [Bacillus massilinigeriensis]|uniref:MFS transporter n=1 Tax=Bacillus massilionigeriensis TaxID=1805475 RepID=UPI00096B5A81|nr:MFS transporter [Bacillus massilionigeriensis]
MIWNRNFTLLLLGQSVANIGDILYVVGVISTIYSITESASAAALVPFIVSTSMFLSSLFTPLLIGKVNLKWLLTCSQIGKTIILFIVGIAMVKITLANLYWLFILISLIAFLDGCSNPIRQTLIPHYVKKEHLIQANGLVETFSQVIQAVMWFVGSLFLLVMNSNQLIWFVGGLFLLSSFMLSFLENVIYETQQSEGQIKQLKRGWETLSQTPVLRKMASIYFLETISGTVWIAAILYVFTSEILHVGEKWWGFINGAYFVGLMIGSMFCIRFSTFIEKNLASFIFTGSLASSMITILFGLNSIPVISLFLSIGIGMFAQIKMIPQQTVIQTSVSIEQLSTVYTSLGAIETGIFGLGSFIMGILTDLMGVRIVFVIAGVLLGVVTIIVYKHKRLFLSSQYQQ